MSNDIVENGYIFYENVFNSNPNLWFIGLFAAWDIFYFSKPFVNSCQLLGDAIMLNYEGISEGLFSISRLLNNLSNNFDEAVTAYSDVQKFMVSP